MPLVPFLTVSAGSGAFQNQQSAFYREAVEDPEFQIHLHFLGRKSNPQIKKLLDSSPITIGLWNKTENKQKKMLQSSLKQTQKNKLHFLPNLLPTPKFQTPKTISFNQNQHKIRNGSSPKPPFLPLTEIADHRVLTMRDCSLNCTLQLFYGRWI